MERPGPAANRVPSGGNSLRYKRPFDLSVLIAGHLVLFPIMIALWLVIPLAIWLDDRGPVLFRQTRLGRNGRPFPLLKFRTMVEGAEATGLWTADRDPRVTRVGEFLRRTALDELAQVINILKGDIGFVGPRALPTKMHEDATQEEPRFPERLQVMPGLTGIAQMYQPRHCSPRRRLRYDLLYIKRASMWLDIRLILLALWYVVTRRWGTGRLKPEGELEDSTKVIAEETN